MYASIVEASWVYQPKHQASPLVSLVSSFYKNHKGYKSSPYLGMDVFNLCGNSHTDRGEFSLIDYMLILENHKTECLPSLIFTNDNGSSNFYVDCLFPLSLPRLYWT